MSKFAGLIRATVLCAAIAAFPPTDAFVAAMEAAGLAVRAVEPLTFGVCTLYVATATPRGIA